MDFKLLTPPSYLFVSGVSPAVFSHIFAALAEFYQLAPWNLFPEEVPIELRYPKGGTGRIVVITGSAGDVFGFSVYDSADDLGRMFQAQDPLDILQNLSWVTLCYEASTNIAPEDLERINEEGWPIVSDEAYPVIHRLGAPGAEIYPPARDDLLWLEAALPAMNETFRGQGVFMSTGDILPRELTLNVQTSASLTQVELCIPAQEHTRI